MDLTHLSAFLEDDSMSGSGGVFSLKSNFKKPSKLD